MKYLILRHLVDLGRAGPKESVLLFPGHLSHKEVIPSGMVAVSAGYVVMNREEGTIGCSGASKSTGLQSRPALDSHIIAAWLFSGESVSTLGSLAEDEVWDMAGPLGRLADSAWMVPKN